MLRAWEEQRPDWGVIGGRPAGGDRREACWGVIGGRPAGGLMDDPSQQGPGPQRKGMGGARKGKSCRAWLCAGLACRLQVSSVVFRNSQACSPGHVLPSPLAHHIPLHTQASKLHSEPCWSRTRRKQRPRHTQRLTDTGTATNVKTQRDNTGPDEAKRPRHKQTHRYNKPILPDT